MTGRKAGKAVHPNRILLDTHTLVWALSDPNSLSRAARGALDGGEFIASVASLWELLIKRRRPGALLADPVPWWERYVVRSGIPVIAIRQPHVAMLGELADHHRDPFDRILVAQAMVEKAALVSKDESLAVYGVRVIW